nr:glycohydrolase toxin TNT-related protein [Schaalia odontolytica]
MEDLSEGWTIKSGKAAAWNQQPGGATQLQVMKNDGDPASVQELLTNGILKGKDKSVGIHG